MKRISIGIHVHAELERLQATLAFLKEYTAQPYELLLLPDGPDVATAAFLETLNGVPQSSTQKPLGPPACFNRMAAATEADVLVFLESGALVGPKWLDILLAALDAQALNGLAGPSTNLAWNEQGAFRNVPGTHSGITHAAQKAVQRFGTAWRTLEPLYSLADFCYVVRREVIQAIGAADEDYGLGPNWEMDYNIRAARAGFQGVWACGAFVYRSPFSARRRELEPRLFPASKRRYQDKFCALHLRGERSTYETHCRGDACEHFAPRQLIQINLPLEAAKPDLLVSRNDSSGATETSVSGAQKQDNTFGDPISQSVHRPVVSVGTQTAPLVSCIMPTANRSEYVLQSICYFQRQDYPNLELVIVDDGNDNLKERLPDDPRIVYRYISPGASIGAKRNRACEIARGSIIAHWDDDDWYAPNRISVQVLQLEAGTVDICGFNRTIFFELDRWAFWTCTPELHCRLFLEDVHGGSIVFRKHVWQSLARYPSRSLAEDALFLQTAVSRGARLARILNRGEFIYLRHGRNSWRFPCGRYLDPGSWQRIEEPDLPSSDRAFYSAQISAHPEIILEDVLKQVTPDQPLVSCIMPTADRRVFIPQAIQYFLNQNYPHSELIIVDDGADCIQDLVPDSPRIHYYRLTSRMTVGSKRNFACQNANGDVIIHWDDDDWMAPWRLKYQVANLLREQADVSGLNKVIYFDTKKKQAWKYIYPEGNRPWLAGNTLCYTRKFWKSNPFPDINSGEDTHFIWRQGAKKLYPLLDPTFYVALIHPKNTSPKQTSNDYWHPYSLEDLQQVLGKDWSFLAGL